MTDLITLGEIATRTSMLTVACSRCERRGSYRLDKLIARHGADAGGRRGIRENSVAGWHAWLRTCNAARQSRVLHYVF
jgi:hypothetical protein